MMPLQRVRVAESRMRNKLSNGPLRARGNDSGDFVWIKVYRDVQAYVSCRGYVCIL